MHSEHHQWLLAANLEQLQHVLDRALLGTFEHDLGQEVVRLSRLACELYGVPVQQEMPLAQLLARIHPDDLARRQSSFQAALVAGDSGFYEVEYRVGPPAFARWLQVRGRVVLAHDGGRPDRVVGVVSDITQQKSREESLLSLEAILDAIGKSSDAFIYAKDSSGRMLYCNDAVLRSLGRQRHEVIGRTDCEFLGPGAATAAIMADDAQVLREERTMVFTETLQSVGRRYLSTKTPFRDAQGRVVGLAGVSIDMTEIENTRTALARVEERAAMAAEAAEIGIYDFDPRANRLVWSDTLREQFGLDLGQEVTLDVALERIHPEDRERVAAAIARALDPAGDGRYNIEYRTVPVAGQPRWLHVLGRVSFEGQGPQRQAVRFSGVSVNITRHKQLEEDLRFQLDLTRNITDNATTAIFMMDARSRCTFMNPAAEKMTGYRFEEVRGGVLHDFIHHHHPDGRPYPMEECPIDRALPEQFDVVSHEDVLVRKNGEFFPVVVNAKPIRKGGAAVGTVIEMRDVTLEREALQRLRELTASLAEADRRKDEFLATLAHELRNPLAPIRTAASLLAQPSIQPPQLSCAAQIIQRQVGHMAHLLDDLMDVARITRGKLTVERRRSRWIEIVEAATEAVQPLVQRKKHQLLVTQLPADTCVEVDAHRITQILSNLLANAARYTPEGGRIVLEAKACGTDLTVRVTDNGIGIPAEELEQVFDMFSQGRSGATAGAGGLGIGLALSRALAFLHGGELAASSEGPGRGSTFALRLPGSICDLVADGAGTDTLAGVRPMRILLADDNRDAVEALALMLQMSGHDARTVYGGREALRAAGEFRPDAIILDIGMPDMTGYEVARALRQQLWARSTRLIALTGWGQQADKELAQAAGFDLHFTKPADPAALLAALTPELA